jgi:quaternary ammonium compound-resistance protein SugE
VFITANGSPNNTATRLRLTVSRYEREYVECAVVPVGHIESHVRSVAESDVMSWIILFVAGLFEIAWAIGLEYSDGFSEPIPTAGTVVALVISMALLGKAVQDLPIGTAYAVWTGIGAVGTASLGIVLFDEPATGARLLFISVIVFGIVGLHLVSGGH